MNNTKLGKLLIARATFRTLIFIDFPVNTVNVSETFYFGISHGSAIYGKGKVSSEGRGGN